MGKFVEDANKMKVRIQSRYFEHLGLDVSERILFVIHLLQHQINAKTIEIDYLF